MARGRPRKGYPELRLKPDNEARLSRHLEISILRDGYKLAALAKPWYLPAVDERLGDAATAGWLAEYRAKYPDDWKRMLRTLRRSGGSTTWTQATAERKSKRDVSGLATTDNILSDQDEPVYLEDLAHVMTLYPGIDRAHKRKRQPIHRFQAYGSGAFIDPDEPGEINLVVVQEAINVAIVPISEAPDGSLSVA